MPVLVWFTWAGASEVSRCRFWGRRGKVPGPGTVENVEADQGSCEDCPDAIES